MPWLIGIDEAGYGPNLGPLVMSAVACQLPADCVDGDLWHLLGAAVRRRGQGNDGRLLVDDSKLVYAADNGLAALERAALALLADKNHGPLTLARLIEQIGARHQEELGRELWYRGDTPLPLQAGDWDTSQKTLEVASRQCQCQWGQVRMVIMCPPRFNGLLDRHGSKGAILALGLAELLGHFVHLDGAEPLHFVIDKHGGRHYYSSLIQQACAGGLVAVRAEGPDLSAYEVLGLPRPVHLSFQPRADAAHLCVALASMVSKYLRELLMLEFNRFWQERVPGLKATAGYPGDAARFMTDIRPALAALGVSDSQLWRRK